MDRIKKGGLATVAAWSVSTLLASPSEAQGLEWVFNPENELWYGLDSANLSWSQAEAAAQAMSGHLAMPLSHGENEFVSDFAGGGSAPWIGVRKVGTQWTLATGEPASYVAWCPGEPNNAGGIEGFAMLNWCSDGGWNDGANNNLRRSVIEVDARWHYSDITGKWYRLSTQQAGWEQHRAWALQFGGDLACIESQAENDLLMALFGPDLPPDSVNGCGQCRIAFIGLEDSNSTGLWSWSDGTPLIYLNWASGQPGSGPGEYGVINWDGFGRWGTARHHDSLVAIFELESTDCNQDGVPDAFELFLGLPIDDNGNGVHDSCELLATPYCFCPPGTSPCSTASLDSGCPNSTGQGGVITASGTTSVAPGADDLVLTATMLPPNKWGLFYMGGASTQVPFGDGLRCVDPGSSGIFRFPLMYSFQGGVVQLGPGIVNYSHMYFAPSGHIVANSTWYFQCWYRDPNGPCGLGFNLTNAVQVNFTP